MYDDDDDNDSDDNNADDNDDNEHILPTVTTTVEDYGKVEQYVAAEMEVGRKRGNGGSTVYQLAPADCSRVDIVDIRLFARES